MKQEKKDEYGCSLFIDTDNEDPLIITELSGITCSEMIVKGSKWLSPMTKRVVEGKYNENNLWIYRAEKEYSSLGIYLNDPLEKLLDLMDINKNVFIGILKKYTNNHIKCYAYFQDFNPYFIMNKNIIKRLAEYNISVEFDIYFLK